jgi:hypothetical protein
MSNESLGQQLIQAVERGNSIEVKSLIDQGADVDYCSSKNYYWDDVIH